MIGKEAHIGFLVMQQGLSFEDATRVVDAVFEQGESSKAEATMFPTLGVVEITVKSKSLVGVQQTVYFPIADMLAIVGRILVEGNARPGEARHIVQGVTA